MTNSQKSIGLMALITKGLLLHGAQSGAATLGDRTAYIGMSDIGSGMECLRAAVAYKTSHSFEIQPSELDRLSHRGNLETILPVLQRQLVLQRGHWQETGIEKAISAIDGIKHIPQLTISVKIDGVPIQAHLDLTLVWGGNNPAVRVLELKSNARIPETLYASYEAQLYGQVSLLAAYWNTPSFSITDADGNTILASKTFPEVSKHCFDVDLPLAADSVDIEGWVLSVSMDSAKPFGPYQPNDYALQACLAKAKDIWGQTQAIKAGSASLNDIPYAKGFHPLCDYCDQNAQCPKFAKAIAHDEYDEELRHLKELKNIAADLKAKIEEIENRIRKTYRAVAHDGEWVETGGYRFRLTSQAGRDSLNKDALTNELLFLLEGNEEGVLNILSRVTKQGEPFTRLTVSPIKLTSKTGSVKQGAA